MLPDRGQLNVTRAQTNSYFQVFSAMTVIVGRTQELEFMSIPYVAYLRACMSPLWITKMSSIYLSHSWSSILYLLPPGVSGEFYFNLFHCFLSHLSGPALRFRRRKIDSDTTTAALLLLGYGLFTN